MQSNSKPVDAAAHLPVTTIITIWKRHYLREQLDALLNQTQLPQQVWIVHYENHIKVASLVEEYATLFSSLSYIKSDLNLKYFGRFSIASHAPTEFVWLLDDDVIPGRKWLEVSYRKCRQFNAIIGSTGRIIPKNDFFPEKNDHGNAAEFFIGDCFNADEMNYCPGDTVVDFACNSYFFRSSWMQDFWSIWPVTFLSGEDIHLSASLKIKKNILTIVPAQLCAETTGNLKKAYSCDPLSSWLKPGFFEIREGVFRHLIQSWGWKPLLWS